MKECFQPFVQRGGTILAISGNHDSDVFFTTLRDAMDLISPVEKQTDVHPYGRFYIAPNARTVSLQSSEGEIVQFVLMPYPTVRYLRREESLRFQNIEERNHAIGAAFKQVLRTLQSRLDESRPAILVGHIAVRGVTTAAQYYLDQSNGVMLEHSDLSFPWAYVALGHMHRPGEVIPGASHMRYAGSIECMDYGERNDRKSVVLLEIRDSQIVDSPQVLPLQSTPFYEIEITDPETQIALLAEQYPDAKQALVRYILHWDSSTQHWQRYCQEIEAIFPRWYDRKLQDTHRGTVSEASLTFQQTHEVAATVRHYLQTTLVDRPEAERSGLLELAEQLFVEEGLV
jgi:DNA repair exonuclease SbcCD nuclease subunit